MLFKLNALLKKRPAEMLNFQSIEVSDQLQDMKLKASEKETLSLI